MSIFGSNYHTVNTVGFIPLFGKEPNGDHDYWLNTVGQAYAQEQGSLDSGVLGSYLLQVNKYLNYAAYEKLGGTSEMVLELRLVDDAAVDAIVSANPDYVSTDGYNYIGSMNMLSPLQTVLFAANSHYGFNGKNCGDISVMEEWHWGTDYILSISAHVDIPNQTVSMTINVTSGSFVVNMPYILDWYNLYYNSSDGCMNAQSTEAVNVEEVVQPGQEAKGLFVRYKVGGVINESKFIKAINARLGIPNKEPAKDPDDPPPPDAQTMEEILEDSETIMYGITYAAKYEEPFIGIIDMITDNTYEMVIDGIDGGEEGSIIYRTKGDYDSIASGALDPHTMMTCAINGVDILYRPPVGEDVEPRYVIPLQYLTKLNLMDKYDAVQNALCFVVHKKTVTKLKWYQTRLFQILLWVAAFALAATGNPTLLIGMSATTLAKAINDDLAIIIGIVFAVYTLGTGLVSSSTTMAGNFANLTKLVEAVSKYYFNNEFEMLQAQVDAGNDENEEILEQLQEFKKRGIFMPLDRIGAYADTITGSLYNMYDVVFETENYMQLPPTTP